MPCILLLAPLYISYLAGGMYRTDENGNIYGYAPGSLSEDMVRSIIQQTIDSVENN